jgi:hypothetical protein
MQRLFHCMYHESANNGSPQSTDRIVIRLQVVKPKELGFTPRRARGSPLERNMQIKPTQLTIQWEPGLKRPGPETNHEQ